MKECSAKEIVTDETRIEAETKSGMNKCIQFAFVDSSKNVCCSVKVCYIPPKVWAKLEVEYFLQLRPLAHACFVSNFLSVTLPSIYPFCRCVLSCYLIVQLKRSSILYSIMQFRHKYKLVDFIRELSDSCCRLDTILKTNAMLLSGHHHCCCYNVRNELLKPVLGLK